MTRITIPLEPEEAEALHIIAHEEKRDPRQQASMLLRQALQGRGLLNQDDASSKNGNQGGRHARQS